MSKLLKDDFLKDIFGNAANLYKPFHLNYKFLTGYIVIR